MKTFVVDASFILSYLLPDEISAEADDIFTDFEHRHLDLMSTDLLPFEICNSLYVGTLRKRFTQEAAVKFAKHFFGLRINLEGVDFFESLNIACKFKLSVYDAVYIQFAHERQFPLLTLDNRLKAASRQYGGE